MTSQLDLHLEACVQCEQALADPDQGDLCPLGESLLLTELTEAYGE